MRYKKAKLPVIITPCIKCCENMVGFTCDQDSCHKWQIFNAQIKTLETVKKSNPQGLFTPCKHKLPDPYDVAGHSCDEVESVIN